jgi:2-dehydropantoate 2-reductase
MKIAVMGTGGLGGYFGGQMAHAGLDVTFIARGRHMEAIRDNGLQVISPGNDFLVKPAIVTDNPANVGPVDLILFCVKAYDAAAAAEQARPLVGAQTAILPVLNGIHHIDQLREILGVEHVLGGMAACGAHVVAPGVIQHTALNTITFGELTIGRSERCESIQAALAVSGIQLVVSPDVTQSMWLKLTNLSGLGVCSAVRGGFFMVRSAPETLALVHQAAAETVSLAHARHIALPATLPDQLVAILKNAASDFKPSMLVDLEHGRRLEIESLNGAVSHMGEEFGVPTPVNDYIYACLKPWASGAPKQTVM